MNNIRDKIRHEFLGRLPSCNDDILSISGDVEEIRIYPDIWYSYRFMLKLQIIINSNENNHYEHSLKQAEAAFEHELFGDIKQKARHHLIRLKNQIYGNGDHKYLKDLEAIEKLIFGDQT